MEDLLHGMPEVDVYIDDIGIFSNLWKEHLESVDHILKILMCSNFMVNPLKCDWGVQEMDWLGYWLTLRGLSHDKKFNAILAIECPKMITEL